MNAIAPAEREPVLDALRGLAILGILAVNIEVMRGPGWLVMLGGGTVAAESRWDALVRFAVGWLATGKFLSMLAILFGVGAALIASRSLAAGESPRTLLARRYAGLLAFGLGHMLLYPGDILFLYGLTGLALLPFTRLRTRTLLGWSAAIYAVYVVLALRAWTPDYRNLGDAELDLALNPLLTQATAAFLEGSYRDMIAANASQAALLQPLQLAALPWILSLFLFGYAIARAGVVSNLAAHRAWLRRGAWLGLAVGLPANFAIGFGGPLAGWGGTLADEPLFITYWSLFGQLIGQPILAVGYLCALALFCLRRGAPSSLAAVGRMALTAYVLQSALAVAVFGELRFYDRLSTASSLLVAALIWALLLVLCPAWLSRFRFGPLEWLWRTLTYRRVQ